MIDLDRVLGESLLFHFAQKEAEILSAPEKSRRIWQLSTLMLMESVSDDTLNDECGEAEGNCQRKPPTRQLSVSGKNCVVLPIILAEIEP
jgi:hypothetical protein